MNMFIIRHGNNYSEERKYIYDVIFNTFFGIPYQTVSEDRRNVCIEYNGKSLILDDTFFQTEQQDYFKKISLPRQPLEKWKVENESAKKCFVDELVPIIYGESNSENSYLKILHDRAEIGIDIFGSAFFMMTRYEEVVKENRDQHDRFSAKDSIAYQEGFLERPIINEYIELLWFVMKQLWPEIKRKPRKFTIVPTHDVDRPFELLFLPIHRIGRNLVGDLIKRKSIKCFAKRLIDAIRVKCGEGQSDPYYTFDLIMDLSDEIGVKSTFFMMNTEDLSFMDGNYNIENIEIIKLMKYIIKRGHDIGLHPSYVSYKDGKEIKNEADKLLNVLRKNDINVANAGARQHYLRWSCPETWQYYENAGLTYDSTLCYPESAGFRCGVCWEYNVFNLKTRQTLQLIERPLIAMECTLISKEYMDIDYETAYNILDRLKNICKRYQGGFVFLWHNNNLVHKKDIELYKKLLL